MTISTTALQVGYHYGAQVYHDAWPLYTYSEDTKFTYQFENFFHPYVGELIKKLNTSASIGEMLDPAFLQGLTADFFAATYTELESDVVALEVFPKQIDVSDGGPYANYNWELLFHIPMTIAVHLSKNQRFAEAQRWFHYIFDPTCTDTTVPAPQRFWKFLRFRQNTDVQQFDDLLALLSKPEAQCTSTEIVLRTKVLAGYEAIKKKPFKPHAVARTRTVAYQYTTVMKYLDNLIAWGDSLFAEDTVESLNEATLRYVLAANILGPRPVQLPERGTVAPKTFAQLKAAGLDAMGDALVNLEGQFPFNLALPPAPDAPQTGPLFGLGRTLYFCIPHNSKLLGYWDTVADRLFKLRHCMNIEGVVRQLALFDPPIDPGMLVKAAAAGIDIGSIVNGLGQPVSPVRCQVLIQQALGLAAEVRGLGGALLSTLEKGDAEHLALVRQGHEIELQQLSQDVRFLQWKQAQEATQSLLRSRATTLERYRSYLRLLGQAPDGMAAPDILTITAPELSEATFDQAYATLVGQYDKPIMLQSLPAPRLAGTSSPAAQGGAAGVGQLYLNTNEDADLNIHGPAARDHRLDAMAGDRVSAVLALIPDMGLDLHFWGLGGHANVFGGSLLAGAGRFFSSLKSTSATTEESQGGNATKTAGFQRRADDWVTQSNLAARELMQMGRQIIGSLIAEQIAYREYLNVKTQITQAQDVQTFLQTKFTSEELYGWMQGETSRLYYAYYRLAADTARKAERTMKHELMRPELDGTSFIQFDYWDGGRKGLLCGEALYLDLKRLELAYRDNNKREFELTRHISLRQLDPVALLRFRTTGACDITIPEWLYDRDCPGHYMRRIKSVALSLPSVVGPYTSLNCTLSLQRSSIRVSPLLTANTYARGGPDDTRFVDYFGSTEAIVTSTGSNDGGLFETNLQDERFLPFEGAGAISTWHLQLPRPADFPPFDYTTIADVILHVRYTARQGGDLLGNRAMTELRQALADPTASQLALLFWLRSDFPSEWAAFVNGTGSLGIQLRKDYFPYFVQGRTLAINALDLYASTGQTISHRGVDVPATLSSELNGPSRASALAVAPDPSVLTSDAEQVFLVVRYSVT